MNQIACQICNTSSRFRRCNYLLHSTLAYCVTGGSGRVTWPRIYQQIQKSPGLLSVGSDRA